MAGYLEEGRQGGVEVIEACGRGLLKPSLKRAPAWLFCCRTL
ncbi:MAG: hypothetical protein ACXWC4_09870 [Telluria sp.]